MARALWRSIDGPFTIFSDCGGEVAESFGDSTITRGSIGLGSRNSRGDSCFGTCSNEHRLIMLETRCQGGFWMGPLYQDNTSATVTNRVVLGC